MAHERICVVDGTQYKYCPHCSQYNSNEQWRYIYCSENCMAIDKIADKYSVGKISKEDAKAELAKLDVSKRGSFAPKIKASIEDILASSTVETVEVEKSEAETAEAPFVPFRKGKKKNIIVNEEVNTTE